MVSGSFGQSAKLLRLVLLRNLPGNMNLSEKNPGVTDLCVFDCYFELTGSGSIFSVYIYTLYKL